MLANQTKAPDFSALDQSGKEHTLSEYAGKYVVLYFYPKDDIPGCTTEACSLRDNFTLLKTFAVILGVSADSVDSHKKFAEKYHLPFTLLSDPTKAIITAYEAGGLFTKRVTYLISPQGTIEKVYPKVDPSTHSKEILQDLQGIHQS